MLRAALVFLSVLLCSPPIHADVSGGNILLPSYTAMERRIAADQREIGDPEEPPEYVAMLREVHKTRVALMHLVEGRIDRFNDAILSLLENTPDTSDPYVAAQIAELFLYAVEADLAVTNAEFIELLEESIGALAGSSSISSEQVALFRASLDYLVGDSAGLQRLCNEQYDGRPEDVKFVRGYVHLLAGKLTADPALLAVAVELLENAADLVNPESEFESTISVGGRSSQALAVRERQLQYGRASLHYADALRLLSGTQQDFVVRRNTINDAATAAATARRHIELIDNPLMWGAAHRVTSEVLDALYVVESVRASSNVVEEIARLRDRAFELSVAYR